MTSRIEIEPKLFQIRMYGEGKADNYIGSCQVFTYGDRAFLFSITGEEEGIYKALPLACEEIFALGVRTLEGYVTDAHVRLFRRALLGKGFEIAVASRGIMAGREMPWVVVEKVARLAE